MKHNEIKKSLHVCVIIFNWSTSMLSAMRLVKWELYKLAGTFELQSLQKSEAFLLIVEMISGRALHFVFKNADRKKNLYFFRDILGMQVSELKICLNYFIKMFFY